MEEVLNTLPSLFFRTGSGDNSSAAPVCPLHGLPLPLSAPHWWAHTVNFRHVSNCEAVAENTSLTRPSPNCLRYIKTYSSGKSKIPLWLQLLQFQGRDTETEDMQRCHNASTRKEHSQNTESSAAGGHKSRAEWFCTVQFF